MPWFGFAALACTLSLPASSFQISTPIGNSILRTANFKEPFNVTATPVDGLSCSIQYGEFIPVEVNNCRNALEKIPRDLDPHIYIRRHRSVQPTSPRYVPLPARYLSDDGMCAIDVMLDQSSPNDEASSSLFYDKAKLVIDECIRWRKGGMIKDFTAQKNLKIVVSRYEPTVDCEPQPQAVPSYENCEDVLEWMPCTVKKFGFTTVEQRHHDPHRVPYKLPRNFVSRQRPRPCHVVVDMPQRLPPTQESWFNIWAAGVAVNTMCVQHGMDGKAVSLGQNGEITVAVGL